MTGRKRKGEGGSKVVVLESGGWIEEGSIGRKQIQRDRDGKRRNSEERKIELLERTIGNDDDEDKEVIARLSEQEQQSRGRRRRRGQ